jgi:uncharacterized repeat protein (TIGR01451 family)
MKMKVNSIAIFIIMASLVVFSAGPVAGQSVYLSANHHTSEFDAWNINADGTVTKQATYNLVHSTDPSGIAIDAVTADTTPIIFITSEFSGGVEIVNPITLEYIGVSSGPSNLAGIDVDDVDDIVYALLRETRNLYIYHWDAVAKTLVQQAMIELPGMWYGYGIALDDSRDILWVTDTPNSTVRAYNVNVSSWTDIVEIPTLSFSVSHPPIDVVVDSKRNLVYTVGGWANSVLLSKYDVAAGVEATVDCGGGIGVAVEEIRGYVYITRGLYQGGGSMDDIQVWDCSTSPFTLIQETGDIGDPAGLAIGNIVGFDPYNLAKNDAVQGYGVYIGQTFTYEITFENTDTLHDMTGVTVVDDLPVELDFVSETVGGVPGTGMYDAVVHTVTWDIGTIPAGQAGPLIELVVKVNQNATPDSTIYNWATIDSDEWPPHTEPGMDPDNPDPEDPGTPVLPNILVDIDIKPRSCPNPLRTASRGVFPVAILGTDEFDVTTVDPSTVQLEGVPALRDWLEDVSTPIDRDEDSCACTTEGVDGFMDMTLKFDNQQILAALDSVTDGETRVLTLTGATYDGVPLLGRDCVKIIRKIKSADISSISNVAKSTTDIPSTVTLGSNYPNPFNPETDISFSLPEKTQVSLVIYNVLGEKVKTLLSAEMDVGIHTIHWDGKDEDGNKVASGIYFYRLKADDFVKTKRMILMK